LRAAAFRRAPFALLSIVFAPMAAISVAEEASVE
jgi:hypothetical protein